MSDEACAEVTREGRWLYSIRIHDGITTWAPYPAGCWTVLGRQRAERKAARMLAKYREERQRRRETWEIR